MPRPAVSDAAEALFQSLGPWARADGELTGWALLHFCEATAGRMIQPLMDIVDNGNNGEPGWSIVLDADRAPAKWLPWLAQFVGVRMVPGLTESAMRFRVKSTDGFKRGTRKAVEDAARQFLIGPDGKPESATVTVVERHGSPYKLTVTVVSSQMTTDAATIYKAVLEQKPGGLVLNPISVVSGIDYLTLRDTHASYAVVRSSYVDYAAVRTGP